MIRKKIFIAIKHVKCIITGNQCFISFKNIFSPDFHPSSKLLKQESNYKHKGNFFENYGTLPPVNYNHKNYFRELFFNIFSRNTPFSFCFRNSLFFTIQFIEIRDRFISVYKEIFRLVRLETGPM